MQHAGWSKKRKALLLSLGAVAGTLALLMAGFLSARAVVAARLDPLGSDAAPGSAFWKLSVNYSPAPTPAPVITFRADSEGAFPAEGYVHALGEPLALAGTVYANRPITAVTVSITCAHNMQSPYPYRRSVRPTAETGTYSFADPNTEEGVALGELLDFSKLLVGVHTIKVVASCEGMKSAEIYRARFYVAGEEWETITRENFPDSYPEALAFFGDTERFLYRYQWVNGRYILADPEWEKTYITTIEAYPDGTPWNVHIDAVPYFEAAFSYLSRAYFRVHGTNGDTGVLCADRLIGEYNGCYVSRFTSTLKAISHHTFGTAVDLNASMEPNKHIPENKAVIADDVRDHLVYNGIRFEGDLAYYDFTYDGAYATDANGVPQTCVNYLLYELAFYRAGFLWAHYYKSTSDGMHFCLSEYVTLKHDGKDGLQKVFAYADEMDAAELERIKNATPAPTAEPTPAPSDSPAPTAKTSPSPAG